jgi:DNA-binding HxlR family transcriptional regulator
VSQPPATTAPPPRRSYDQYCGLARALDLVGERWTMLVVRELMLGPKRFTDLIEGLPGVGRGLLAARLGHLTDQGIVRQRLLPPPAGSKVYELTELGERLGEALLPLQQWGREFLGEPGSMRHARVEWLMIHFRRGLRPENARGVHESYELRFPGEAWHLRVDDGEFDLRRGPAKDPACVGSFDLETFALLGLGKLSVQEAIADGRFGVEGDPAAAARSLAIIGLVEPAESD